MSAAELSNAATRHPWDWYVEQPWVTEQLINTLPVNYFDETTIYDPCCGRGTIPRVFSNPHRYDAIGSDLFKRWPDHQTLFRCDFRSKSAGEIIHSAGLDEKNISIVSNFPYSQQDGKLVRGLAEEFCRKALQIATHRVCALLPIKWMAGQARQRFLSEHPPRFYLILNERPSMPPGDMIEKMGYQAFKRGKVDYMWVVWDKQVVTLPGEPRTIHIAPRSKEERA